ncbi:V-type ATP synthase subunit E family protein [Microbispora sp. H11081]|uniref:V-type ATP synthase subunit E family protein n=1 Tax=Microbispora sp. H11081 TaxID=2729107 RepID=UPI0014756A52|nr:V-type ATP synthase subunit E family protein [Microbispora sp. H11081]
MIALRDALEPVAEALLRQARQDADAVTHAARRGAAQTIEDARRQAREIIDAAREQGEAEGKAYSAATRARSARQARRTELAARRDALEELRRRAGEAVRALRDEPGYPRLVERLAELAREAGGDDLVVREHPGGGVVAEGPGRRVDCSLEALAGRAVDALGAEVERLWAP